jgi:hypothetical protein
MSQQNGKDTQPFNFGPSPFDISEIFGATGQNDQEIQARYNQLGMGGSTPEQQDLSNQNLLGEAAVGQTQTQEVGNPAFNPALQTPIQPNIAGDIGAATGLTKLAGSLGA